MGGRWAKWGGGERELGCKREGLSGEVVGGWQGWEWERAYLGGADQSGAEGIIATRLVFHAVHCRLDHVQSI